ncbi:MAG: pyridoxal phosphate-dependent aminotransferase [Acidimicrobiales bacterium]
MSGSSEIANEVVAAGRVRRALDRAGRLDDYGTTIFATMSAEAARLGAVNLGQGFPDTDGPPELLEAARAAITAGHNQYAPGPGTPELLGAIAEHQRRFYGVEVDAASEILVTAGATEAMAASILALCEPGDEVVTFEPYYDSYAATIELSGARRRVVTLRPPAWQFDPDELRAALGPSTRAILLNSPHNPTGRVFDEVELDLIASLCIEHDLLAFTDEVYEHLIFSGAHLPLSRLPGMGDRTITISSGGKTFSATGWKIGWAIGPGRLIAAVRSVKQFLTFTSGTPFQLAIATALAFPDSYFAGLAATLKARRDQLCDGLGAIGWTVLRPAATYFATVDVRPLGYSDGLELCGRLVRDFKVAAIPTGVFYDHADVGKPYVRLAFCKKEEVIAEALRRLSAVPLA